MAFRKSVKCTCRFVGHCFGFNEPKFVNDSQFGSGTRQVLRSIDVDELSKSSLPLVSLDTVRRTGRFISGNVSFAPSDPANIEPAISDALSSYTANYLESHSTNEDISDNKNV